MRYPASEKLEIIRLVEQSHLPVRRTLEKLGILPGSFYHCEAEASIENARRSGCSRMRQRRLSPSKRSSREGVTTSALTG
jgi:transposase-like protein